MSRSLLAWITGSGYNRTMAVIIKIGGSLLQCPDVLVRVCETISRIRAPVGVVAGGGKLADCVRDMQSRLGFDDITAHVLALKAMDMNAVALCESIDRGVAVSNLEDFGASWSGNTIPIWLPSALCERDARLVESWDTTSDAIAARLCERLPASGVVVLKSCEVDAGASLGEIAARGVVDLEFPKIVSRAVMVWRVLGPSQHQNLASICDDMLRYRRENSDVVGAHL